MTETREDKYKAAYELCYKDLSTTEKAQLTKLKNTLTDTNSEYLAMALSAMMFAYEQTNKKIKE
jgi:hypothetical protein